MATLLTHIYWLQIILFYKCFQEKWHEEEERVLRSSKDLKNSLTSSQQGANNNINNLNNTALTSSSQMLVSGSNNTPLTKEDLFALKSRRNCEYFSVCRKFKSSLGLPGFYFDKVNIFPSHYLYLSIYLSISLYPLYLSLLYLWLIQFLSL